MLGRENVVVHSLLIVVCILCERVNGEEELGELEHIVRVAGLGALAVFHEADVVVCGGEVLAAAVASDHY